MGFTFLLDIPSILAMIRGYTMCSEEGIQSEPEPGKPGGLDPEPLDPEPAGRVRGSRSSEPRGVTLMGLLMVVVVVSFFIGSVIPLGKLALGRWGEAKLAQDISQLESRLYEHSAGGRRSFDVPVGSNFQIPGYSTDTVLLSQVIESHLIPDASVLESGLPLTRAVNYTHVFGKRRKAKGHILLPPGELFDPAACHREGGFLGYAVFGGSVGYDCWAAADSPPYYIEMSFPGANYARCLGLARRLTGQANPYMVKENPETTTQYVPDRYDVEGFEVFYGSNTETGQSLAEDATYKVVCTPRKSQVDGVVVQGDMAITLMRIRGTCASCR